MFNYYLLIMDERKAKETRKREERENSKYLLPLINHNRSLIDVLMEQPEIE